jgi:hypothetical protein
MTSNSLGFNNNNKNNIANNGDDDDLMNQNKELREINHRLEQYITTVRKTIKHTYFK